MSRNSARDRPDGRSDLYSLGVTFTSSAPAMCRFRAHLTGDLQTRQHRRPRRAGCPTCRSGWRDHLRRLAKAGRALRHCRGVDRRARCAGRRAGILTAVPGREAEARPTCWNCRRRASSPPGGGDVQPRRRGGRHVDAGQPGRREAARLAVEGVPAGWLTLPGEITCRRSQREAAIGVLVPRDPSVASGDYPVTLRATRATPRSAARRRACAGRCSRTAPGTWRSRLNGAAGG
jgi:hypothetical protein